MAFSVVIADDEPGIRNGLKEIIPWASYEADVVETAPDGITALSAIRRLRPDLVVMDIKMPGMDGLEVLRCIREEGITSRFIILSGYNDFSLAQKAIRHGANAYFLKPLKVDEFKDELSRQFADILASGFRDEDVRVDDLLRTSRLFLFNQLIRSEIRSHEELERRCAALRLSVDPRGTCRVLVFTDPHADDADLPELLDKAESFLVRQYAGKRAEVWTYTDRYVILLMHSGSGDGPEDALKRDLEERLTRFESLTGIRLTAGVGTVVSGPVQAAGSFSAALRALSYSLYRLPGHVYDSSVICTRMPFHGRPEPEVYENLFRAVESGDESEIEPACRAFIRALLYVPAPPPEYIRGKCVMMVSSLCERLNGLHPDAGPFPMPDQEDIHSLRTLEDLTRWLIVCLTGYQQRHRSALRPSDALIKAAKAYILAHLSENIRAIDVAAEVNLSPSYFTIYFKAKAGCNFRDYVLNEKIRYAKECLLKGMNVSEIADAVGYTDYRSFSRAFKNVTGHTPSEFLNT